MSNDGFESRERFETTTKAKLMNYLDNPIITKERNSMGCSENWYNSFYAIKETFSREEIMAMSKEEIERLEKLATTISDGLY